eukprot:TRINITY_DN18868_c0_g1_i1.p3 TRINITY_DN18868_c0_g1~~TRINITY_DN18868_c0_g1_i1.p3  ORF type:complete len:136 (+),score=5.32 TRINITY_DN18868_c0_g1_i1:227-634(+)
MRGSFGWGVDSSKSRDKRREWMGARPTRRTDVTVVFLLGFVAGISLCVVILWTAGLIGPKNQRSPSLTVDHQELVQGMHQLSEMQVKYLKTELFRCMKDVATFRSHAEAYQKTLGDRCPASALCASIREVGVDLV